MEIFNWNRHFADVLHRQRYRFHQNLDSLRCRLAMAQPEDDTLLAERVLNRALHGTDYDPSSVALICW